MKVFLTEHEVELAKRLADGRNLKNGQVPNAKHSRRHKDWEIHYAGTRSEIAVCKYFEFPVDQHMSYHGDSGNADLYVDSLRVEVKSAMYEPPILKLDRLTDFKSDIIILCHVYKVGHKDESIVDVWGVVSRFRFQRDHYIKDFGYGPRVCMDGKDMKSVDCVKKWLEQLKSEL